MFQIELPEGLPLRFVCDNEEFVCLEEADKLALMFLIYSHCMLKVTSLCLQSRTGGEDVLKAHHNALSLRRRVLTYFIGQKESIINV